MVRHAYPPTRPAVATSAPLRQERLQQNGQSGRSDDAPACARRPRWYNGAHCPRGPTKEEDTLDLLESARRIVDILAAKFGSDILLLDLSGLTIIADYFVIASGESVRQLRSMAEDLRLQLRDELNMVPLAVEGTAESGWVLLDYGSIVVHLFSEAQRDRYRLEEFWADARTVVRMA